MSERSAMPELRFQEVTPDLWKDFETLFGGRGVVEMDNRKAIAEIEAVELI